MSHHNKSLSTAFMLFAAIMITTCLFSQGATVGERINMGLYGGSAYDLTFCPTNHRLFAAIETPGSVFVTDDTCKTWYRAFPTDSLEFMSGSRGWGGGATIILANRKGWVAVQTNQQGGTLSSAVISFSGGDTLSWKTVLDRQLLEKLTGSPANGNTAMTLSDHWMYMGMGNYLARYNDTTSFNSSMLVAKTDTMAGVPVNAQIRSLAVANSTSGYPVFMCIGGNSVNSGKLYKYESTGFSLISLPANQILQRVFTHPAQLAGDTLFVSCRDTITNLSTLYSSINQGISWNNITPPFMQNWTLANADYSDAWVSLMPVSNGLRINLPGLAFSDDLGSTWKRFQLVNNGNATHLSDTTLVIGSMGRGVVVSNNGVRGPFVFPDNYGLSAVKTNKIATAGGVYYLSSNAGLAYTTAYFDNTVAPFDKWNTPHGKFPVANVGDDSGISTVAINPNDNQHVIAGYAHGFSVSRTGPSGFSYVNPANWHSTPQKNKTVTDIQFITSDIVLATTGAGMGVADSGVITGNIWRSTDGGSSWTVVTPSGLQQPNCLAAGITASDTVIYCGTGHASGGAPPVNGELWKSDDVGLTWTKVNDGPNSIKGTDLLMPVYDIAVDPRGTDTIYIASGRNLGHAFVRSVDGGATYQYTSVSGEGAFTAVLVDGTNNDIVYSAIRREIHIYNARTGTHALVNRGMPGEFVPDLENGSLLAATNTGFYKIIVPQHILNDFTTNTNSPDMEMISIFPNPVVDVLNIRINKPFKQITIRLFDMQGKLLIEKQTNNAFSTLNTHNMQKGNCILQVVVDNVSYEHKLIRKQN
jgi:hypothetical protein